MIDINVFFFFVCYNYHYQRHYYSYFENNFMTNNDFYQDIYNDFKQVLEGGVYIYINIVPYTI